MSYTRMIQYRSYAIIFCYVLHLSEFKIKVMDSEVNELSKSLEAQMITEFLLVLVCSIL